MSYERDAYDAARALSLHRMTDGELRQHAAGGEAMATEVLAERFCDGYCGLCDSCDEEES